MISTRLEPFRGRRSLLRRFVLPGAGAAVLAAALSVAALAAAGEAPGDPTPLAVEDLVRQADAHIRAGRVFEAIEVLDKAVESAPSRHDIRLRLANLQKQRGLWLRSADNYRAVLAADASSVPARLGYAELLFADYQFRAAAAEFQRVVDGRADIPDRDRALVGLGSAKYAMEEYQEAADTFRLILARKPHELSALAYLSLSLRRLGDLEGSVAGWRRYLEYSPGTTRARYHLAEVEDLLAEIGRRKAAAASGRAEPLEKLGEILLEKPDRAAAAEAFRAAIAAEPGRTTARLRLGIALRDLGRCGEAEPELRQAAEDPLVGALAAYNLAYCARRLERPDLEARAWASVLRTNPRDAYAYRRYLGALDRSRALEGEVRDTVDAIKARPGDPLPRIHYAVLARQTGQEREAARALLDAIGIEPNDPYAQSELRSLLSLRRSAADALLAEIAAASGKGEEPVVTAFRKAAVLSATGRAAEAGALLKPFADPGGGDSRAMVGLAVARRSAGEPPEAVLDLLRAARDRAPGYLYARLDLAMSLEASFRVDEAIAEAEAALRIAPGDPYALTILGAALRARGGEASLARAEGAFRRALQAEPMDPTGAARLLLAKVIWERGGEREARAALRGDLPVDPEEMYRLAWEFVRDHYQDRTFNGQDWNVWREKFRDGLGTRADAQAAVALMLASLDNRDTRLRSAEQTANLFFSPRSTKIERDSLGRTAMDSRSVETKTLEGNVGYVAITNMNDPSLVQEVRGAVEGMKESESLILDLRGNPGGSERDAEEITSMLVPPGTPTGKIVDAGGQEVQKATSPAPPIVPDKPVVVLIDRNTGSSAEALAGALQESRRAVVVGESTYGKAGIQVPLLLADGTTLLVATAEHASLAGLSYSGVGIEPDVRVTGAMPARDGGEDAAMSKAREILSKERDRKRQAPGRPPAP